VNVGGRPGEAFAGLARVRPDDPAMCMEFWCGWFDHWGAEHVVRDPREAAEALAEILRAGASVNIYMAHGGTNFSTWAGANTKDPATGAHYLPTVTSYDYDAPIDERGGATEKFWAFRDVLKEYAQAPLPEPEDPAPLLPPARVELTESLRLFDVLDALAGPEVRAPLPPSFEELGLAHGLVLYTGRIPGPRQPYPLSVHGLADRAHVYVDGVHSGVLERDAAEELHDVAVPAAARLELLVESMGRVNYGAGLGDRKGVRRVLHTQQTLHGWRARPVELGHGTPERLPWGCGVPRGFEPTGRGPVFLRGTLEADQPADGWLSLPGGGKGYVWVNGFCLGRYWQSRGPQQTLYVPWPLLRAGRNEVVVLELDADLGTLPAAVETCEAPELG
jgi:beta-galactosidase